MTVFALAIPFTGLAVANHGGDNTHDLQVTPETDENPTGTGHTLTATVDAGAGSEVDFEIESGPAVRANCTPGADGAPCPGGTTSDTDASATSPDLTCTTNAAGTCSVFFTSDTTGTNVIRAWVDDDKDNATFDADQTEGRDEATAPGSRTEVDDTDVVSKTWFSAAAANVRLDCQDDDTTDTETNPAGQAEVYTCRVFNNNGTPGDTTDDTVVANSQIDAEISGANDPDNRGFADVLNTTADVNNACTTTASGTCQYTLNPAENEVGTATVCFWLDEDNDAEFANGAQANRSFDGGNCNGEAATADEPDSNKTDVVQKTWQQAGQPNTLDASPERDSNVKGTSHTVSATVLDTFGNPAANVLVDFVVTGANAGQGCQNVATNATGVATCTYTDSTTIVGPEPETDTINVAVDGSAAADATVDEVDADLADQVEKFWFTTVPTANNLVLDMNPTDLDVFTAANCDDAADSTATNPVNTNHDFCGVVYGGPGATNPVAGANVTLTLTGPGNFVDEGATTGNAGADRNDDVARGQSITVTTDAAGRYNATITSNATGTTTVTATSGAATDTGTKTWTANAARTLDCEPETATNPSGTQHVFTCTARDRFGNPTAEAGEDDTVSFSESGPGRITSATTVALSSTGQAEVVVETTADETGNQTILGMLDSDDDDITPLNRGDNNEGNPADTTANDECDALAGQTAAGATDTGAPAGVCADEVVKTWGEQQPVEPECSDGIDNDGDGFTDFPDDPDCDSIEDNSESDVGGRFPSNISIRYDADASPPAFKGKVASSRRECKQNRRVVLKKVTPGPNRTVGTDRTNRRGNWRIVKRRARGRYYAVVRPATKTAESGATLVCGKDRSVTIKITR